MPFTIARLVELKLLKAWEPTGGRMIVRRFYYSERWAAGIRMLAGKANGHTVRWWDEPSLPSSVPSNPSTPEIDLVALDLSERGHICGLVETFVIGRPVAQMIRNAGFGMYPPFERMRAPRQAVVEMKTEQTRTFGFVSKGTYVAHIIDTASNTHANKSLYEIFGDDIIRVLLPKFYSTEVEGVSDISSILY